MFGCRSVGAPMRAWDKAALCGTVQSVARKDARTGRRAWRHVLWTHSAPLLQITHSHSGVLDVGAGGQTRYFNRSPRRSIAELKAARVVLIHHPRWDIRS